MTARDQTDTTLANIDAVLGPLHEPTADWEVGPDAMRSRPVDDHDLPEHEPAGKDFITEMHEADAIVFSFDPAYLDSGLFAWREGDRIHVSHEPPRDDRTPGERMADWLEAEADRDHVPDDQRAAYIEHLASTTRAALIRSRFELDQALANARQTRVGRLVLRLHAWLLSWPLHRAWTRIRNRKVPASRTLTVTITANADRYRQAVSEMRQAIAAMGAPASEAGARLKRVIDAINFEVRAGAQMADIREHADVHRHELARWWDDHLDQTYADLGLERPTTTGDTDA